MGAQAQNLLDLFHRDDVRDRLRALAHEMTVPDPLAVSEWILDTVTATAAEAPSRRTEKTGPAPVFSFAVDSSPAAPRR